MQKNAINHEKLVVGEDLAVDYHDGVFPYQSSLLRQETNTSVRLSQARLKTDMVAVYLRN
ncbi:hypothetical protein [Glutamicibacter sp. AOP5-A2-18]|uniref:hypothetical protein n=1 Tax=Glutamicibacter sp. AOP5-A2-18 TaxID=3457656 RepID=UPI004033E810